VHLFSFITKKPTNNKKNGIKGGGEERGGIRLQIFRFFGGRVWSEGKKKGRHGRIVSDRHGHPLVHMKFTK
jgi:hypothetical protein